MSKAINGGLDIQALPSAIAQSIRTTLASYSIALYDDTGHPLTPAGVTAMLDKIARSASQAVLSAFTETDE